MTSADDTGVLALPVSSRDHAQGSPAARLTLVEYGDFECPHCGRAHPILKMVQRELGVDLRFVFRYFPLKSIHPHAEHAAEAAEAGAAQGRFWEMHDTLFEHQRALDDEHLGRYAEGMGLDRARFERELRDHTHAHRVREDFMSGVRSGVNGTPTFFVNGRRYDGAWEDAQAFIGALRAEIRHPPPG